MLVSLHIFDDIFIHFMRILVSVVATFPKQGNGPQHDDSLSARLNGLKWLATQVCKNIVNIKFAYSKD